MKGNREVEESGAVAGEGRGGRGLGRERRLAKGEVAGEGSGGGGRREAGEGRHGGILAGEGSGASGVRQVR